MGKPTYICAARCDDPLVYVVPGSIRRLCACLHYCWLSPSSQEYLALHPFTAVRCIQCTAARTTFRAGLDELVRVVSPTAQAEMEQAEKHLAKRRS